MSRRSVLPGLPETKINSPSAAPAVRPLEIMLDLGRLAVLIDAEEADVEVVAGILEVVGIAAEEGGGLLGGEDQPHVGVFLVAVEMVQAAVVERDHVAPQTGLLGRFLLDRVHDRAAGLFRLGRRAVLGNGRVDPLGDVLDAHEHVQFQIDALDFLRPASWHRSPRPGNSCPWC